MPFKSEAQRRYLWANEPEIARDWTDTYGSRIQKNGGGIMQGGVENYLGQQKEVTAPLKWQSSPDHPTTELAYITQAEKDLLVKQDLHNSLKGGVNRGPSGIMSLNGWGSIEGGVGSGGRDVGMSGAATSAAETGSRNAKDVRDVQAQMGTANLGPGVMPEQAKDYRSAAIAAGAGQNVNPGWFGPRNRPGISKQDLGAAKAFAPNAYRATRGSPFGIGNLFRGAMSMFGGIPGRAMSLLSHLDPRQLRGINSLGGYNTQRQYEDARDKRIADQRIANILGRKAPITKAMQERLEELGYTGDRPGVGSTGTSRAIDRDYTMEDTLREYPISTNRIAELQNQNKLPYEEFTDDVALSKMRAFPDQAYEQFAPDDQDIRSIANEYTPGNWKGSKSPSWFYENFLKNFGYR